MDQADNTHLLHKGKYHCTADLLFYWFGIRFSVMFNLRNFVAHFEQLL